MERVRLLVVDDHPLFRQGLAVILKDQEWLQIVGEAETGQEALKKARELRPDVVLMDIDLPDMSGIEATRMIVQELPETTVAMLSVSAKSTDLTESLRVGAKGYLVKSTDPESLIASIRRLVKGDLAISSVMVAKLVGGLVTDEGARRSRSRSGVQELTPRERETLTLLARGASNKEIAKALCVSENTVRAHVRNIVYKLGVHNRVEAVALAYKEGLLT